MERRGVRVFWGRDGDGEPTVLFLPDLDDLSLALLEGPDPVLRAPTGYSRRSTREQTAGPIGREYLMGTQSSSSQPKRSP
jgi:hypothetical protein